MGGTSSTRGLGRVRVRVRDGVRVRVRVRDAVRDGLALFHPNPNPSRNPDLARLAALVSSCRHRPPCASTPPWYMVRVRVRVRVRGS